MLVRPSHFGVVLLLVVGLVTTSAEAQSITLRAPEVCATEEGVRERLASFGIERVEDATLSITTSTSWSGLVRGELRLTQRGVTVVRALEDLACEDVVAALVIAAALALREGLHAETAATRARDVPDLLVLDVHETETARPDPTPRASTLRLAIGLEGRVGFGPVPGIAFAPGLVGALSLDAFVAAARLVYWPESAAFGDGTEPFGASVRAFVGTLEAGGRVGEEVGVSATGVIEVGASISRGIGLAEPVDVTSALADVGLAVAMDGRLGPVTLFVRFDFLVALVQPTYLVGEFLAFEGPPLRGSLSLGALVGTE